MHHQNLSWALKIQSKEKFLRFLKEVCPTETMNNYIRPRRIQNTPLAKCMLKMHMEEMENFKKLFITAHFIAYWNKPYSDFEKQIELIRKLGISVKEKYVNRTMCTEFIITSLLQLERNL